MFLVNTFTEVLNFEITGTATIHTGVKVAEMQVLTNNTMTMHFEGECILHIPLTILVKSKPLNILSQYLDVKHRINIFPGDESWL